MPMTFCMYKISLFYLFLIGKKKKENTYISINKEVIKYIRLFPYNEMIIQLFKKGASQVVTVVEESTCQCRRWVHGLGWEDSLELENFQIHSGILADPMDGKEPGYSPWDNKEWDGDLAHMHT